MKINSAAHSSAVLLTGEITTTRKLQVVSRNPALASGTLPILYGELQRNLWIEGSSAPLYMGYGTLLGTEQYLLSFRLQVGATMVYWLADPHDSEIVAVMKNWVAGNQIAAAIKTRAGIFVLGRDYPAIALPIQKICESRSEMDTQRFLRSANEIVASGLLQSIATSDIPSVNRLKKVHAFFVLSSNANAALTKQAH